MDLENWGMSTCTVYTLCDISGPFCWGHRFTFNRCALGLRICSGLQWEEGIMIFHCNIWHLPSVSLLLISCRYYKIKLYPCCWPIYLTPQISASQDPLVVILVLLYVTVIISISLPMIKCCHLGLNILGSSYLKDTRKPSFKAASSPVKTDLQMIVTIILFPHVKWDWKPEEVCHQLMFVLQRQD